MSLRLAKAPTYHATCSKSIDRVTAGCGALERTKIITIVSPGYDNRLFIVDYRGFVTKRMT